MGYSPWSCKESDAAEHTHTHYKRRRARVHILESEPDGVTAHTNLREPGDTEKVRAKEQSKWKQQMGGRS